MTTINTREQAAQLAEASTRNTPNGCQAWTRAIFGAPSVGDLDHDGAADAEDGWKSEPAKARHTDRHPPRGVPVAYLGGSSDNGHRAISLGPINGVWMIRSTDAAGSGKVATVPLDWPEKTWGLKYAGWSETIDGFPIPHLPKPTHVSEGRDYLDQAIDALDQASPKRKRAKAWNAALKAIRNALPTR